MALGRPKKLLELEKIAEVIQNETESIIETPFITETQGDFSKMVSTGSTLLDLAISGGRCEGGGVPGGILVEIFGPSGWGKSALLCSICGSAQARGGNGVFIDVEGRIDKEYARIYGMSFRDNDWEILGPEKTGTIESFFEVIQNWNPGEGKGLNVIVADSLAAMVTVEELTSKGDKMAGMRRAARFSEGLRKVKAVLSQKSRLLVCSNQTREDMDGGIGFASVPDKPTGGKAIGFYASLRIQVSPAYKQGVSSNQYISMMRKIEGKEHARRIGIHSLCKIVKSSVDAPYREAVVPIIFSYGIDDVRGNLEYLRDIRGAREHVLEEKSLGGTIDKAISVVEEEGLEDKLKQETIKEWNLLEENFKVERKPKVFR